MKGAGKIILAAVSNFALGGPVKVENLAEANQGVIGAFAESVTN